MRNRELIYRKLETLDHTLINLQRIVNTQEPIESYRANINSITWPFIIYLAGTLKKYSFFPSPFFSDPEGLIIIEFYQNNKAFLQSSEM